MVHRLLLTMALLQLLACSESPYNNSPSALLDQNDRTGSVAKKEVEQFNTFIDSLSSNAAIEVKHPIQQLASRYFPDSTIHRDHLLYGRNFPLPDSSQVIYFEYSLSDPPSSNAYLGLFSKEGEALDLISIKEVSYDGSISIHMIDNQVLEVEYYDFFNRNKLFKSEIYTDHHQRSSGQPYWQKTSLYDRPNGIIDYYYYENYMIRPDGHFKLLQQRDTINLNRRYPFVSLRVTTMEELQQYSPRQLRKMINEIYASHGFIFRNPKLMAYYKRKSWYKPRFDNIDQLLTDIEYINIKKMAKLEAEKEKEDEK